MSLHKDPRGPSKTLPTPHLDDDQLISSATSVAQLSSLQNVSCSLLILKYYNQTASFLSKTLHPFVPLLAGYGMFVFSCSNQSLVTGPASFFLHSEIQSAIKSCPFTSYRVLGDLGVSPKVSCIGSFGSSAVMWDVVEPLRGGAWWEAVMSWGHYLQMD